MLLWHTSIFRQPISFNYAMKSSVEIFFQGIINHIFHTAYTSAPVQVSNKGPDTHSDFGRVTGDKWFKTLPSLWYTSTTFLKLTRKIVYFYWYNKVFFIFTLRKSLATSLQSWCTQRLPKAMYTCRRSDAISHQTSDLCLAMFPAISVLIYQILQ